MSRSVPNSVLKSLLVVVGAVLICVLAGCGGRTAATASNSPAASPAPSWLVQAAAASAKMLGDAHPTAAYWGTDRGPAGKAYVVVLVGDYSKAQRLLSFPTNAQATAFPPVKWLRIVFAGAKHDVASYGVYTNAFDVSRHPDLQPLHL